MLPTDMLLYTRTQTRLVVYFIFSVVQKSKPNEKVPRPEYGVVYVAEGYPSWQHLTLVKLGEMYNEAENSLPPNKEVFEKLKSLPELKPHMKKLMPFVQQVKDNIAVKKAEALQLTLPFDEKATLMINLNYLVRSLEVCVCACVCVCVRVCVCIRERERERPLMTQ